MNWLNNLKIAVVDKNIENIGMLITNVPYITNMNEAQEALALINQAISIVEDEKLKTLEIMNKIKQTKAFISS